MTGGQLECNLQFYYSQCGRNGVGLLKNGGGSFSSALHQNMSFKRKVVQKSVLLTTCATRFIDTTMHRQLNELQLLNSVALWEGMPNEQGFLLSCFDQEGHSELDF